MANIAIIGAGYVGLVSAACFAKNKTYSVIVVERDREKIAALKHGKAPFYEPSLDDLVREGIASGTLLFVHSIAAALAQKPSVVLLCVGTPSLPDGSADLSAVYSVVDEIGDHIEHSCVVVTKSTVPVGTAHEIECRLQEKLTQRGSSVVVHIASNPEFLKEGTAVTDSMQPDRVVIGTSSEAAAESLRALYEPFVTSHKQLLVMSRESAELTKYASNAMLATRISFMNQLARLADIVGADIEAVRHGMSFDSRIGAEFLRAGVGYGGSCFPKDVRALAHTGKRYGVPMSLVEEVDKINNEQRQWFVDQIQSWFGNRLAGAVLGVWGLAFKPDTDDIRSAPSIDIIEQLLKGGARVVAYDPVAVEHIRKLFGSRIEYATQADEVLKRAAGLIVTTEWKEFLAIPATRFLSLRERVVFDGRNCLDHGALRKAGVSYVSVGRNKALAGAAKSSLNVNAHHSQPQLVG